MRSDSPVAHFAFEPPIPQVLYYLATEACRIVNKKPTDHKSRNGTIRLPMLHLQNQFEVALIIIPGAKLRKAGDDRIVPEPHHLGCWSSSCKILLGDNPSTLVTSSNSCAERVADDDSRSDRYDRNLGLCDAAYLMI